MIRFGRLTISMLCALLLVGTLFPAFAPTKAEAASCGGPNIAFGRQRWCGYFGNGIDQNGNSVISSGIPASVDTTPEFIALVKGWLNSGDAWQTTGAQFLILTMIGRAPGAPKSVSAAELVKWEQSVGSYADLSTSGGISYGTNGRIDWNVSDYKPCDYFNGTYSGVAFNNFAAINTYYQKGDGVGLDDVAAYFDTDCYTTYLQPWQAPNPSAVKHDFIYFRDTSGNVIYRVRRLCANPIGQLGGLQQPQPAYDLRPSVTAQLAGGGNASAGVEVGQTVEFRYSVLNQGVGASPANTSCTAYTNVHNGYVAARSNPATGGGAGPPTGCPRSFPGNNANTPLGGVESVVVTVDNQTICRSLFVSPATGTVASRGFEVCVQVAAKPFVSVRGGDVSAGGGVETLANCSTTNSGAAIIGWNRGAANGYQGAGVQFAAYALGTILDVATSQGNGAGAAATPIGLSFANTTTTPAAGRFGGSFGSVPCVSDHYGTLPAAHSTINSTSVSAALASGVHFRSGDLTLTSGAIDPGRKISVYVNGDVYINGNVTYANSGTWSSKNVPLFRLVVSGDIYIAPGVSQLDGLYVAQSQNGTTGGVIHTCATGLRAPVDLTSLAGSCGTQLVVNGSFTARQVRLLRTYDSLRSGNAAEIFNYSPALWIAQPADISTGVEWYDSITSLPPVL